MNMKLNASMSEMSEGAKYVSDLKTAYNDLKEAVSGYAQAKKSGDADGAGYWQAQVESSRQVIENLKETRSGIELNQSQQAQVNDMLTQAGTLQAQHAKNVEGTVAQTKSWKDELSRILLQYASLQAVVSKSIQVITQVFNAAVSYSSEFYDQLNEIRIVTGTSEAEAEKMGAQYRQMASDMSVSSKEIASAAVEFYRQGLGDAEVNER